MRQVNDLSYIARDSLTSVKATTAAGTLAQLGEAEKILDVTLRCHSTDDQQEEAKRKLRRLHYSVMSLLGQMLPESIRSEMSVDWCLDPWLDHQWRLNMIGRD